MDIMNDVYWNNKAWVWATALGIVVGSLITAWIAAVLLRRYVVSGAEETENRFDDLVAEIGVRPIALIIFLAGAHGSTKALTLPPYVTQLIWSFFVVGWTVVGTVFIIRLLSGLLAHYVQRYAEESEKALYLQLVQTVRSSVRVVVWIVAALFMFSNLGLNVSSLLAGLGLGGLALALASKDTLSNIFGSFTILVNGPYRAGEAITYHGHTGVVESIGLRDTKIRTYDGHLIMVPNSLAPTSVVINISRRPSYRCLFKLGLTYDTATDKIEQAKTIITEAVAAQKGTTEDIRVHFTDFNDSSIDLQVIYFITDYAELLNIRHAVNEKILADFEAAGIKIAYKTITLDKSAA